MNISISDECTNTLTTRDMNNLLNQVDVAADRLKTVNYKLDEEWNNIDHFKKSWIDHMKIFYKSISANVENSRKI
jgi:hypothetical protein